MIIIMMSSSAGGGSRWSSNGNNNESKELGWWLLSVLAGILLCKFVYELTALLSLSLFKGYTKLSNAHKLEWNNRGFSTFHALLVALASAYILFVSDLFEENSQMGLITYRASTLSYTILGMSLGYFLSDLAMILWTFPALGGLEYVLHHGLSMVSILQSLLSGQAHFYILMVLFTESTTPFVNLRWYLDKAGQKKSYFYTCNGVALFLGWILLVAYVPVKLTQDTYNVARILLFVFFFYHMFIYFDQVKQVYSLGFYSLLTIPPTLAMMNVFWFWKITKGVIKTLSKAHDI